MTETTQQREGQSIAVIVLVAQVDSIQGKIDRLWTYDDEVLKAAEGKLLRHQLKITKQALEWAKGQSI